MKKTEIDISPLQFNKIIKLIKKYYKITVLIGSICIIFFLCLMFYKNSITNNVILDVIQGNKQGAFFSKKCVNLSSKDINLINNLSSFLNNQYYYRDNNSVVNVNFVNFPKLSKKSENNATTQVKKELFIKMILPLIVKLNTIALQDKQKLISLRSKMPKEELNDNDMIIFNKLSYKYNLKTKVNTLWDVVSGINELILRINTIPNSLVLAAAIKETGWWKSRSLQEENSLFSEWELNNKNQGIQPLNKINRVNHTVKKYKSLYSAVESFFININSINVYKNFRNLRMKQNLTGKYNVFTLASTLDAYAKSGNDSSSLKDIIRQNDLTKFDKYNYIDYSQKEICLYFN